MEFLGANEISYIISLSLALVAGLIIGMERELKGKPAGMSTQTLVIAAAMTFTFISREVGGEDPTRIASQIVAGVGFLGAGVILRSESTKRISNLTTAASIWYAAAIGMALGFDYHFIAILATLYAVVISRIPHIKKQDPDDPEKTTEEDKK